MNPYLKNVFFGLLLIIIFSLQLCLLAYEHHSQCNPLIITYCYILFTHRSLTTLSILAFMLDGLTTIITGITGLSIIFLVPTSWLTLHAQDSMYNKIVLPCLLITSYVIFYNIILYQVLSYPLHIGQIIWAILQNCLCFLILWWLQKQPFHD